MNNSLKQNKQTRLTFYYFTISRSMFGSSSLDLLIKSCLDVARGRGRGKREERRGNVGRGKREEGREKREEGRGMHLKLHTIPVQSAAAPVPPTTCGTITTPLLGFR